MTGALDQVRGGAVDMARIMRLPFVRIRVALPEDIFTGDVAHACAPQSPQPLRLNADLRSNLPPLLARTGFPLPLAPPTSKTTRAPARAPARHGDALQPAVGPAIVYATPGLRQSVQGCGLRVCGVSSVLQEVGLS